MFFIRIIHREAWRKLRFYDSDAISDIGTTNHGLSVWAVPDDDVDTFERVKLAIALTRKTNFIDMEIVKITDKELSKRNLRLVETEGQTLYKKMKTSHRDIILKNVCDMLKVTHLINKKIRKELFEEIDINTAIQLFDKYYEAGEIPDNDIKDGKYLKDYKKRHNGS